ncbi:MAG: TonB family protein [Alphaproteobacteria bacterium]
MTPPPKAVREAKAVRTTLHDEAALEPPPPPPPPKPARPAATPVPVVPSSVATEPEVAVAPMPADPVQSAAASAPVAPPKAVKAPETKVAIAPRPAAFVDVSDTPPAPREPASGGLARLSPDYDKGVPSPAGDREAAGAALAGNPPPEYPYLARRRGIEGSVVVGVTVLSDGYPQRVWVIASSGHGILDRAAATAVRKWKFIAARRRGAPVAASIEVPITFRLED